MNWQATAVNPGRLIKEIEEVCVKKVFALMGMGLALAICQPAFSQSAESVSGSVQINAAPNHVWEAVHNERAKDPDLSYSKVIQQKGSKILLEQKFNALPVIGEATCLMVQEETPLKRIDYKLVKSDKFKSMSGSWILEETPAGGTSLQLQSVLDTGLPYSQGIINNLLKNKISKRLERVKAAAELLAQSKSTPMH